jgi:hypothetical protein
VKECWLLIRKKVIIEDDVAEKNHNIAVRLVEEGFCMADSANFTLQALAVIEGVVGDIFPGPCPGEVVDVYSPPRKRDPSSIPHPDGSKTSDRPHPPPAAAVHQCL